MIALSLSLVEHDVSGKSVTALPDRALMAGWAA
jgi:hypothetical protein